MSDKYDCLAIMNIYAPPTPPNLTWRITMALNRVVTTYRLPLQIVRTGQHSKVNFIPDTTSALTITTLALRKDIRLHHEP